MFDQDATLYDGLFGQWHQLRGHDFRTAHVVPRSPVNMRRDLRAIRIRRFQWVVGLKGHLSARKGRSNDGPRISTLARFIAAVTKFALAMAVIVSVPRLSRRVRLPPAVGLH